MNILILCDPPISKTSLNVGGLHAHVGYFADEIAKLEHKVTIITAELFGQVPAPQRAYDYLEHVLDGQEFEMIHIFSQGRLGLLARRYCLARGLVFTTTYARHPDSRVPGSAVWST
jgi:hypothetical protein